MFHETKPRGPTLATSGDRDHEWGHGPFATHLQHFVIQEGDKKEEGGGVWSIGRGGRGGGPSWTR